MIAKQFTTYALWMARPNNLFTVQVDQNVFQSFSGQLKPDQVFLTCVEENIGNDMKAMIAFNRVRILFKFTLAVLKMKVCEALFPVFELTERQLVDVIPEQHRELFLYVCSQVHLEHEQHLKQRCAT